MISRVLRCALAMCISWILSSSFLVFFLVLFFFFFVCFQTIFVFCLIFLCFFSITSFAPNDSSSDWFPARFPLLLDQFLRSCFNIQCFPYVGFLCAKSNFLSVHCISDTWEFTQPNGVPHFPPNPSVRRGYRMATTSSRPCCLWFSEYVDYLPLMATDSVLIHNGSLSFHKSDDRRSLTVWWQYWANCKTHFVRFHPFNELTTFLFDRG